jgi:hypothetical protein
MRHAAIAQVLLAAAVTLAADRCALIPPSRFTLVAAVAQLPTTRAAVALASVVVDAHGECLAAVEAGDLDEVEVVSARHAAGKADLDSATGWWEALSVTRPSFHLAASTAWPSFPGRPGASTSPR